MHIKAKTQTQNPHQQWEVHKTMNQKQQNHRLRADSSLSHRAQVHLLAQNLLPRFCCC